MLMFTEKTKFYSHDSNDSDQKEKPTKCSHYLQLHMGITALTNGHTSYKKRKERKKKKRHSVNEKNLIMSPVLNTKEPSLSNSTLPSNATYQPQHRSSCMSCSTFNMVFTNVTRLRSQHSISKFSSGTVHIMNNCVLCCNTSTHAVNS